MSTANTFQETLSDATALGAKLFRVRLPFIDEVRRYSRHKLRRDLIAGATVTLVSVPQSIGFALILGLPPMSVIMSVVVGGFVSALFFSSHYHVFGPTTSVCLVTAATIAGNATLGLHPLALAAYLAVLIGAVQVAAGLLNFGAITKFISRSVVIGYTTAIGILLIASQAPNFLGFHVPAGQSFAAVIRAAVHALRMETASPWAIGIGVIALLIFEGVRRWRNFWPEALIGLAVLGAASRIFCFALQHYHPFGLTAAPFLMVRDEGVLIAELPKLSWLPSVSEQLTIAPQLVTTAIAIATIGMLEATAITKSLEAKSGEHVEPNQELLGMGMANLAAGLFGVTPGSSSFSRSAVNYQSGAASQFASMLSSALVLLLLLFFTPIFNFIPIPALAMHLIRVGYKLINREQIRVACRSTRSDLTVFAITVIAALAMKLEAAIFVGIAAALVLALQKTSAPSLVEYTFSDSGHLGEISPGVKRAHPQISIIHVEGELFFGAADVFLRQIRTLAKDENVAVFILRMKNARHLDASIVMAIENLHHYLRSQGRHLIFSGCDRGTMRVLKNSGLLEKIGLENVFAAEINLTLSTKRALQRASDLLGQCPVDARIFYECSGSAPDSIRS